MRLFPTLLALGAALLAAAAPASASRIAFEAVDDGTLLGGGGELQLYSIYSMNADGSDVRRLTNTLGEDHSPAYSPDGTKIAFASSRRGYGTCDPTIEICLGDDTGNYDLYVMNADGSDLHIVAETQLGEFNPAWSPDGTKIAFEADDSYVYVRDLTAPSADPVRVGHGAHPTWSPNGKWLAFMQYDQDGDLFVVDTTDYGHAFNLTHVAGNDFRPFWSPDGTRIAFTRYSENFQQSQVAILPIADTCGDNTERDPAVYGVGPCAAGPAHAVTPWSGYNVVAGWSPDGQKLLVSSDRDGWPPALYVASDLDAGEPTIARLLTATAGIWSASWQPSSDVTTGDVAAGGTLSTGGEATATSPLQTSITSPVAGTVTIEPATGGTATGYDLLGQQFQIEAPDASAAQPLRLEFLLDGSILPSTGFDTVDVFRDGVAIPACAAGADAVAADPDPCVVSRTLLDGGDVRIVVLSSHASRWAFGHHQTYGYQGFLSPVKNLDSAAPFGSSVNAATAGKTVPVKFKLTGTQAGAVLADGYPRSQQIVCGSTAAVDGGEPTASAGRSALTLDAKSRTYTYEWKTDKAYAKTCRQLVVKLRDGSYHRANFRF